MAVKYFSQDTKMPILAQNCIQLTWFPVKLSQKEDSFT